MHVLEVNVRLKAFVAAMFALKPSNILVVK